MADIWSEKLPCNNGRDVKCNVLKVYVYYDIGGYSWATGNPKKRGYYLSVSPLLETEHTVSYQGFSGVTYFLNEVKRQSKKGEAEAIKKALEVKAEVIKYVCDKHGITLKDAA